MKYYLRRVKLNAQGYDNIGSYFGIGHPLYYYMTDEPRTAGNFYPSIYYSGYVRGSTRQKAKDEVLKINAKAMFYK